MLELEFDVYACPPGVEEEQHFSQTLVYPKDFQDKTFLEQCDRLAFHISRRCTPDAKWRGKLCYDNVTRFLPWGDLRGLFWTMFNTQKEIEDYVQSD